jgi:hypothetical protein
MNYITFDSFDGSRRIEMVHGAEAVKFVRAAPPRCTSVGA